MTKTMLKENHKDYSQTLSNKATFFALIAFATLTFFAPQVFTQEPASLPYAISYLCGITVAIFFLLTIVRRKKIALNFTPLLLPLILFAITLVASIIINQLPHPEVSFLGLAGLLLNFAFISILASSLIKEQNGLITVNIILTFACLSTIILLIQLINNFYQFLPTSIVNFINDSSLTYFSVIILGFISLFSKFFKKNQIQVKQFIFTPIFALGLILVLLNLYQSSSTRVLSFHQSNQVLINSLTSDTPQKVTLKNILFGQPHRTYTDLFYNFQTETLTDWNSSYLQAFNLPLALMSQFGLLPLIAWLYLIFQTLAFALSKKNKEHNFVFFILFASFLIQLFTPVSPFILLIQTILVSFTTNKNKETVINLNVSTINTQTDGKKKVFIQEKNYLIFYILFFAILLPLLFVTYRLSQSYIGYIYSEKSLENPDVQNFYQYTNRAQKAAPFIDNFNRLFAIANLEKMVAAIQQDPQGNNVQEERDYAQQAISYIQQAASISPYHTLNLTTKGAIYQEVGQYNSSKDQTNSQAISAYAAAILTQPLNPNLYLQLAAVYQLNNQLDLALNLCQEAIKLQADYLPAIYQLAQIYQLQGNTELAISTYQQAQQLLDINDENYQTNFSLIQQNLDQLQ